MTILVIKYETFLENGMKAFENQHEYKEYICKNLGHKVYVFFKKVFFLYHGHSYFHCPKNVHAEDVC